MLYAVDWNNVFDFGIMVNVVDYFGIMGYDYYYPGSANAGPNDPLYHFGSTYNYTLSRSVSTYVDAGCPKNKLVLGLPYYGFQWPTASLNVPTATTGNGISRTYATVKNNSSGNYILANHQFDNDSYTDIYTYNSGGVDYQTFITEEEAFRKRLQYVNNSGIAGIGIWALGYDDGYNEFWTAINDFLTDCKADSCAGIIHDFGGPSKAYYNNEDYTWTIAPNASTLISVNFTDFDVELNYDTLFIYDGLTAASSLIGAYTGTNSPGSFTTTTGAITFRFKSDGATTSPGFNATYICTIDNTPPTTTVDLNNNWETNDFTVNFTDLDNQTIEESFYLVSDFDGVDWKSNQNNGFLLDSFNTTLTADWTQQTGAWQIVNNELYQSNEAESNSNLYTSLNQTNTESYLYNWTGQINGSGANRRAGIHLFCSDPTLDQRGDSYMVCWRADQDKCQIYRTASNVISIETDDLVIVDPNITYDFKILYSPLSGNLKAFLDDVLVSEWTDPNQIINGNSISLRTGNCIGIYDDFKVYKSRSNSELVTVLTMANDIRYQNQNLSTPAANIQSIIVDEALNWSIIDSEYQNIDWTTPEVLGSVNDGLGSDVNAFNIATQISGNWSSFTDTNSNITAYWYSVGSSLGSTDIVNWTNNGLTTTFTETDLSLLLGATYYIGIYAENGSGLQSTIVNSDGQTLQAGVIPPVASFSTLNTVTICEGEGITFTNTSTNAATYLWDFGNGDISSDEHPTAHYVSSGNYTITLTVTQGGLSNQSAQIINVTVVAQLVADFVNTSPVYLPNSTIYFTNNSTNSTSVIWDFGDGNTFTDYNPWHNYLIAGIYTVTLTVSNGICADGILTQQVEIIDNLGLLSLEDKFAKVYPNPATNQIAIDFNQNIHNANVIITDLSGQLILKRENISGNKIILTLNNISSGVYFVNVLFDKQTKVFKLIIE